MTNPQETKDLVTFSEEILNEKLHFLCSDLISDYYISIFIVQLRNFCGLTEPAIL